MKEFFAVIFLVVACVAICDAQEKAQWQEDLKYLTEQLPLKHPNAFHSVSREQFQSAVRELNEEIPNLNRNQIIAGMMRIVSLIGDGHTSFSPLHDASLGFHYLPVQLYLYKDGLFVQKAMPEFKELVGTRVISIGNASAEQAYRAVAELTPHDNEMGIRSFAPVYMVIPEVLHGLGFNDSEESVKFVFEVNGQRIDKILRPVGKIVPLQQGGPMDTEGWANAVASVPLYLKQRHEPYWFEYLPESKMLYMQYNQIRDKKDETVADFCKRVFEFAENHIVEKFVLDVRFNLGGNNYLNKPVLVGLIQSRKINQRGKLFVIIGRNTFSAAQNLVNEIEKYTNAVFVGEPTAENVNFYGDHEPIILPNSKIPVMVSTLWWQNMDPRDHRKWTSPQISAELTSLDYKSGIDPALESILRCKYDSVAEALEAPLQAGDSALMGDAFKHFVQDPSHQCVNVERELNSLGYQLIENDRIQLAIEIFKMNVEAFPSSGNVYDSLGEAYLKAGQKTLAIENYRKALQLNPANSNVKRILDELSRE